MRNTSRRIACGLVLLLPTLAPAAARTVSGAGEGYAHLLEARLLAREAPAEQVLAHLRAAVQADPGSAGLHAEAATLLLLMGQPGPAEEFARRAVALDPDHRRALRALADACALRAVEAGAPPAYREEALRIYDRLSADAGVAEEVWGLIANLRLQGGEGAAAARAARTFAGLRPDDPEACALLARSLEMEGQPAAALAVLGSFLARHPGEDDLLPRMSEIGRRTDRWDEVEKAAAALIAGDPGRFLPRALRGEALVRMGRPGEAAEELEAALAAAPTRPGRTARSQLLGARSNLLGAYGALGRTADAVGVARSLVDEYPDNPAVQLLLGDALARQEDVEGAIAAYRRALDRIAGRDRSAALQRDELRRRIAELHLQAGRPAEARQVLRDLDDRGGRETLALEARAALAARDLEAAEDRARDLRRGGDDGAAAFVEAEVHLLKGRDRKAGLSLDEAIARGGEGARARAAAVLEDAGRAEAAVAVLGAWVAAEPASAEARFRLGASLDRSGRHADAEVALREAIRLDPAMAAPYNHLGYSLAERDARLDEALTLVRRAVELDPWNGAYLDSLGYVLLRLGRPQEARPPLERAARDLPFDPTVLEHLGDACRALDDREAALRAWRRAAAAGGDAPRLSGKIAAVEAARAGRLPVSSSSSSSSH